ncbi:lysophospholipid acyltransferase family protein [Alteribacter natronophilus]|uniref:lysophospholipid acyltransferase family protein n=1 Tax=Alteribacter natronophilus TaxID=2583810 RepID=UPI002482EFE0|nr:lysophospholipid acyltransferase family protein [Alteribacter natronophilus]
MPSGRGTLFLINHSSWWDSLILFQLNRDLLKTDGYALMSEEGLKKFPFFGKLGAFPVDTSSRTSILRSMNRAVSLIQDGRSVFLFPQGNEYHVDIRPLGFKGGAAWLAEKTSGCDVVPVTFYHTLLHEQLPEFFIRVGSPVSLQKETPRKEMNRILEAELGDQLDGLKEDAISGKTDRFYPLIQGRRTVGDRWYTFKQTFPRIFGRTGQR